MSELAAGAIALTAEQRNQYDEDGFFLVEDALAPSEVEELVAIIDEFDERYRR